MAKQVTVLTDRRFTWDEYLDRVKSRPTVTTEAWNSASMDHGSSFTGTKDFAEAVGLATNGWKEGTARMLKGLEHDSAGDVPSLFPAQEYDVAGEWPDVGAFCAGAPEHMVSAGETRTGTIPVIRLGINGGANWRIEAESIERYGIAVLSHVAAYQRAGYSVALDWLKVASEGGHGSGRVHLTRVEILSAGGILDIDRLAFMLGHPSMLRRFWFADVEMQPEMKGIRSEYGFSEKSTVAPKDWYEGLHLPHIEQVPNYDHATVEEMAAWLGQEIEKRQQTA